MELAKAYNPKEAEQSHYQKWEANGCFAPEINENPNAEAYSIVIPPPNVTGNLHMGHALQHTLMDTLVRWKRMQGYKTLFLVGIDHAGISTQLMVTKKLWAEEKKTRWDLGREEFTRRIWDWKDKYGSEITRQIRREGLSVDWSRERFTMEESLSKAVTNVFVRLFEEGWIYRGLRIVNWCPKDKTVLSDLEVKEETNKDGKLYFLQYPIKDSDQKITVATTRPETMLGDTAVAVNPKDERYQDLIGKTIELPLTNREIPIVADEYVESEFGTGAVKITPAHDPNDYEIGTRHNLEKLVVMNDDATMNENAGAEFNGLDRYFARTKVIEKFEELGLLEKLEDYESVLPVCERCQTVLEPLLSEQWFVKMDEMRDMALNLMRTEGAPHFFPQIPNEKVYISWLENLKDWTISRQLWWGHQIPAWYDFRGNAFVARNFKEAAEQAGTSDLIQDEDVLDTWFSSALWSFSTLGWNGDVTETEDLKTFHPTNVLVTGRDIIRLWVSRMVMTALKFVGEKPFEDVIIHGTVLDKNGQRMSKTKNNGIDPLDVFEKFGVDATRMTLAGSATGADFAWRDERVESFRNFANKIWNATRFCLLNSEGAQVEQQSLILGENASIADKWIISRLNETALDVNKALNRYEFHTAVSLLYHFFWDVFCGWYIELVKDEITNGNLEARTRILTILEQSLRLLHPFMPFLTEELWQKLPNTSSNLHNPAYSNAEKTIMLCDFPKGNENLTYKTAQLRMDKVLALISRVRNLRAVYDIKPSEKVDVILALDADQLKSIISTVPSNEELIEIFKENFPQIAKLAKVNQLSMITKESGKTVTKILGNNLSTTLEFGISIPKASAKTQIIGAEVAIPLEGLIDFDKERERLENQLNKLSTEAERLNKQLSNQNFVEKAPPEKVQDLRDRAAEIEQQTLALNQTLEALN